MATAGSIVVDLLAKTGSFETDMERAARTSRRASSDIAKGADQVGSSWSAAAGLMGAAFAGLSAAGVLTAFVQNTINAQNEQAQLVAALQSTGRAASMTADDLNKMAGSMERATTFSAGEVNQAQTALLAFTGIAGGEFPRAMQAAADMAARTGMTILAAAETIGRSLDVPSQGLASLSRQGFRFTQEQKALVERLEATGRTAEAQGVVLQALEESYKGAAVAARDTLGGSLTALRNTVSALLTDENGSLSALRSVVENLNDALSSDAAKKGMQALVVSVEVLSVAVGVRLAGAVLSAAGSFVAAQASAARYQYTLARMASVSVSAAAGIAGIGAAARVSSAALSLVGGPVGLVALALGGAAYAWTQYGRDARSSASAGVRELTDSKRSVDDLVESFRALNALQRQQTIDIKTEDLQSALRDARTAVFDLGNAFKPSLAEGARAAAKFRTDFSNEIAGIAGDTKLSSEQMASALSAVVESYIASGRASESSRGKLIEMAQKVVEASGNVAGLRQELDALTAAQAAAAGGVAPVVNELDRYRTAYAKFLDDFATPAERLAKAEKEYREKLGPLFNDDAQKRLRDRFLPKSSGASKQASEIQGLIKRLVEQRDTLGLTTEAAERYRIEVAKGSDADRARALSLYDEIQAWNESEKAIQRAMDSGRQYLAFQQELEAFQQRMSLEAAGVGMSDRQREIASQEFAIRQEYAQKRLELEQAQQVASTALDQAQYEERLRRLQEFEDLKLLSVQDSAAARAAAEADWANGARRALQTYADDAANIAAQTEGLFTNAFGRMEDALVDFAMTGKLDLSELVRGIGEDLIRMLIKMGLQMAANAILGNTIAAASTAMAAATGTAMAAAYAPAAALASLASFGANSAPAMAGISSTVGLAQGLAFAGMFDNGGTIPSGQWGIAGEYGPEIIQGPARVVSRRETARMFDSAGAAEPEREIVINMYEDRSKAGTAAISYDERHREVISIFVADIRGGGESWDAISAAAGLKRVGR